MRWIAVAIGMVAASLPAAASEVACPARSFVPEARATYYTPIVGGACSLPIESGEFFAAIADDDYAGSEMCGRCARVTGPAGAVTVRIVDMCVSAECEAGHLDLSEPAFAGIADPLLGDVPISWATVACDVGTDTMQLVFEGSHSFYLKVQVRNHRYGIASVEMHDAGEASWHAMARTMDDHFERFDDGPYETPLFFRITDLHGQSVETTGVPSIDNDVPFDSGVQLAVVCCEPAGALAAATSLVAALRARRRS